MTDLEALATLVKTLREAGVSTYEGPVPEWHNEDGSIMKLAVKLTLRPPDPPAPAAPAPRERPPAPRNDDPPERPRVPAGLGHLVGSGLV